MHQHLHKSFYDTLPVKSLGLLRILFLKEITAFIQYGHIQLIAKTFIVLQNFLLIKESWKKWVHTNMKQHNCFQH